VDGKELGREDADWIHCFQERVHFKLCEMRMNPWVSQKAGGEGDFVTSRVNVVSQEGFLLHDDRVVWTV
jgi:hypothetical protein